MTRLAPLAAPLGALLGASLTLGGCGSESPDGPQPMSVGENEALAGAGEMLDARPASTTGGPESIATSAPRDSTIR